MNSPAKKYIFLRILKWTGISLLLIIALLVAAPFIFKDKIIALVKEETNATLNAKVDFGDFDLSLISSFPDFRFEIHNISVVGVSEFKDDTLAYIENLRTDINLKSVLGGGPYQINSVLIEKASLLGKILKNGKANWDITKPDTAATTGLDAPATKFSLSLKELKVVSTNIVYDDCESNMYSKLENVNYTLSGDFTQDDFLMKNVLEIASTTFKMDGIAYLSNVHTSANADINMNVPQFKFTFKENEFKLNDLTLGLDGMLMMPDTNIDMDIAFRAKQTEFKTLLSLIPAVYAKDFASVQTAGKLALDGYAKGRYNAGSMPAFGTNLTISNAMFKYPSLPKLVEHINVDIKVVNPNGVMDATTVDVNTFHVEMAGNPIDLSAHVKTPISDPDIKASIKGLINLASLKDFVPMDKEDNLSGIIRSNISLDGHMSSIDKKEYDKFKAEGGLEIDQMAYKSKTLPYTVMLNKMVLEFSTQFVALKEFDALLGKSDVKASGKIENFMPYVFKNELIKGAFTVTSNLMDINEMMSSPSTSAAATPSTPADSAAKATASTAAFAVPANIDFNLNANINKVLYSNMVIEHMAGNILIKDEKMDMTNLRMETMGGALTVNGYYESTNLNKPTTALNLKIENFDIQKTFNAFNSVQKLAPVGKYSTGMFTATLENFNVALNNKMEPDLSTVDAGGVFKTKKVMVGGFPPFVKLGETLKIDQLKSMDVSDLNLSYTIKDGRIILAPFDTKVNGVKVNISGSTGLDQSIDYKWKMEIPRSMFGSSANAALNGLLGQANAAAGTNINMSEKINVVALFGGTVMKPTVKTSMKDEVKNAVNTVTTQVVNAGIDKANAEAQKILEDAKAQCDKNKAEAQASADRAKQEGYAAADQLIEQAGNPIAKIAAKKAAEVAKKKVDEKVQKIIAAAEERCRQTIEDAKVKADAKAAESKK